MKKTILTLMIAFVAIVAAKAQQIAVVSASGETMMYQTFDEAIESAAAGSTVYLPGGSFSVSKAVTQKLTIIGVGHNFVGKNADGYTSITGDLWFRSESSGSAVMGCYVTGKVSIGSIEDSKPVNNILVRYCNVNNIRVNRADCTGIIINQNYIHFNAYLGEGGGTITNNVMYCMTGVNGGIIANNIFTLSGSSDKVIMGNNNTITQNVSFAGLLVSGQNNVRSENLCRSGYEWHSMDFWCEKPSSLFENSLGVTPASNYHFREEEQRYETICGIYAGTGFDDSALPPVPHIIAKSIPEQTDAQGKLNIKIRVKAGE